MIKKTNMKKFVLSLSVIGTVVVVVAVCVVVDFSVAVVVVLLSSYMQSHSSHGQPFGQPALQGHCSIASSKSALHWRKQALSC